MMSTIKVSYTLTSFSSTVAEHLVEHSVELTGRNDLSFVESVYKVLRDLFSYKPLLTKQQFLQFGFAERKMGLLCDIIGLVLDKHRQLTKGTKVVSPLRRRTLSRSDSKTVERLTPKETQRASTQRVVRSKSLVERHVGSSVSAQVSAQFSFSSDEPQQQDERDEDEEEQKRDHITPQPAAHPECVSESVLRAVEAGLQECVCRLQQQLNMLDARVQALEKNTSGIICIERSVWQELENRVLLLETGLALTQAQDPVRAGEVRVVKNQHTERTEGKSPNDTSITLVPSSSEENIKERLERIASMMKDTSSLLKNVEPTI
ncbi:centrosomal protein of 44 kDa isoform X2 [Trichomycterus rosablanca]|uniref:centrosomal protein of 44 kDa isoform X2 n=1 Tax=Trichomycterus rosablanca TaxID=2290929 RepID=UPI002F3534D8